MLDLPLLQHLTLVKSSANAPDIELGSRAIHFHGDIP